MESLILGPSYTFRAVAPGRPGMSRDTEGNPTFNGIGFRNGAIAFAAGGATLMFGTSFVETVAKRRSVPLLVEHDPAQVAGKADLSIGATGLLVAGTLLDTTAGRDAAVTLAAGVRGGLSIGFNIASGSGLDAGKCLTRYEGQLTADAEQWMRANPTKPVRIVDTADLVEVSCVLWGAEPGAVVQQGADRPDELLDNVREAELFFAELAAGGAL